MAPGPEPYPTDKPPNIDWDGVKLGSEPHPGHPQGLGVGTEPLEPKLYGGLGLAPLKTEGQPLIFDGEVRLPLTPWGRVRRKLFQIERRVRHAPRRLWWALFGDEYY